MTPGEEADSPFSACFVHKNGGAGSLLQHWYVMVDKKTKFFVGLFVSAGVVIITMTIIWLGMSNFLQKGQHFAVYFDESVQGLNVESPVKYRGVSIGRVEQIRVAADSHLIEVVLEMSPDFHFQENVYAQLKVVGITGNMFIELDRLPEGTPPSPPDLKFPTEYRVIPSRSSEIKQLFKSIDEIVQKLKKIDPFEISLLFKKTLEDLDQAIVGADVPEVARRARSSFTQLNQEIARADIGTTFIRFKQLVDRLDHTVAEMDLTGLSNEAATTMRALRLEAHTLSREARPLLRDTSAAVNSVGEGVSVVNQQMIEISRELERTTRKLNLLLDRINDQPSQLIFGDPPPARRAP